MIILKLAGGLANQMYIYAAGYALARELNRELVLNISLCEEQGGGFSLENFNIPVHRKIKYELSDTGDAFFYCGNELEHFPDAIIAVQTLKDKEKHPNSNRIIQYSGLQMASVLDQYKIICLAGLFFDPGRYFEKYWGELAAFFTLKTENEDVIAFKKIITGKISVGVHVRRRDMVIAERVANWTVSIEDDYYRAAIELYKEMYPNCIFCIFSDDIEYTKEMFGYDESIHYIHFDGGNEASLNELVCLSMCNHRVVSNNSTFGKITDDLNYNKPRHIVFRDANEVTVGVDIERKKKQHRIFLNKQDIKMYNSRFVKKERVREENEPKRLERFNSLIERKQWHSVLEFAREFYFKYQKQEPFILGLYKSLMAIGACEEGKLELFNLPLEKFKVCISKETNKEQEKLLNLYHKNFNNKNKRYILVSNEKMYPGASLQGLIKWIVPLTHLGEQVSIVYEPTDKTASYYLENEHFYNARGVDLGCTHFDKNKILKEGIVEFYNHIQEDELVIISRDCRFFVREGVTKKVTFITTDLSDKEDEEVGYLYKAGIHLLHEMELADFVLTVDKRFKTIGIENGCVYCEVPEKADIEVYDTLYGYGHNFRMEDKTICMVYSLLSVL